MLNDRHTHIVVATTDTGTSSTCHALVDNQPALTDAFGVDLDPPVAGDQSRLGLVHTPPPGNRDVTAGRETQPVIVTVTFQQSGTRLF